MTQATIRSRGSTRLGADATVDQQIKTAFHAADASAQNLKTLAGHPWSLPPGGRVDLARTQRLSSLGRMSEADPFGCRDFIDGLVRAPCVSGG